MTATTSNLHQHLGAIAGAEHTELNPRLSVAGAAPQIAVTPGTIEQVAACLNAAREASATVTPYGGGTRQRMGAPPEHLDVALRMRRLDAVVEWQPADLTACLQAGATLAAIQNCLATRGQQLAIDAAPAESATLGGLVATNASGPRSWLYGGWRDQIIGMHMALSNGDVIKSGGRVVKNVQGYDLAKLFTGSLGTLGVIGQINVKLTPLPASRRLFIARGDLENVAGYIDEVAGSTLRVSTLDLLDAEAAARCRLLGTDFSALVLVDGSWSVIDGQSARLAVMARQFSLATDSVDEEALASVWRAWLDLGRLDDLRPDQALLTIPSTPTGVLETFRALMRQATDLELSPILWARAGNGLVYGRLSAPAGGAQRAFGALQASLMQRWPGTTIAAGDAEVQRILRPWGLDPAALDMMRGLKRRFDPTMTLQPGRFVGGI